MAERTEKGPQRFSKSPTSARREMAECGSVIVFDVKLDARVKAKQKVAPV
jgi:hypothetical protein